MFIASNYLQKVNNVSKEIKTIEKIVLIGGRHFNLFITTLKDFTKDFSKNNFNVREFVKKEIDIVNHPAVIMCSSGTTGLPKGVITTQSNLISCTNGNQERFKNIQARLDGDFIRIFNIGPWFHVLGFVAMYMFACSRESQMVFLTRFEEEAFYKAIEVC